MTAPYARIVDNPDAAMRLKRLRAERGFTPRRSLYRVIFKRLIDTTLVLLLSPLLLPIIAVLAIIIAMNGGQPFYSQRRIGLDGRVFRMWKLRTMMVNADEFLQGYLEKNPAAKAEWDHSQKLRNDPRISDFGRLLRRTSLDELPQLWNVVRGDMSLVGPRPMMVQQQSLYPGLGYYSVRPGLTGYWQISERNKTGFAERAEYDDRYEREVSLSTDLRVLFKTIEVVLKGTGV